MKNVKQVKANYKDLKYYKNNLYDNPSNRNRLYKDNYFEILTNDYIQRVTGPILYEMMRTNSCMCTVTVDTCLLLF